MIVMTVAWFMMSTCSAAADMREFPVVRALLCSLTHCTQDLPVWPMYALEQFEQGMQ